ncbi:DNA-binding protein [Solwaraspora sp. WMMD1047]|uniref:DNA-binding protein n=1 Tax=Solwaraspora sp. WMMD1047 TaxID=3016102 RepID=UPI002416EFA3|nr:DNA-binding protein [Solwaraspora sp. WMMD1047]MDG4831207.1 DNA-binding protein [Solwaraspora sp. WMMD1047]
MPEQLIDPFTPPDASRARAHRQYAALHRITERHGDTSSRRRRHAHADVLEPQDAVRLVLALAAGAAQLEPGEAEVDPADLTSALTLIPHVRADLDAIELGLLTMARQRGLTWQAIGFGLGLGSAQAARQRYERLAGRESASGAGQVAG